MESINPQELQVKLEQNEAYILLDVREAWEYDTCQIDGSINIPLSVLVSSLDELDKSARIVAICHHGMRSYQAAAYLESQGFMNMINLDGGIDLWAQMVEPNMPRY